MTEQEIDTYIDTVMATAVTVEDDETEDWIATIPKLDGVLGVADNRDEALYDLRLSVQDWVNLLTEAGQDLPVALDA